MSKIKISPQLLGLIFTGYSAAYAAGTGMAKPQRDLVATKVPSTGSENKYGWLGKFPGMREWIGERVIQQMQAHGYAIPNKKWEQTIGVDVDTIEDDEYGVFAPMFQEMGRATEAHPDELVWALLKAGFATNMT